MPKPESLGLTIRPPQAYSDNLGCCGIDKERDEEEDCDSEKIY
jgi:hypothetical protein